MPTFAAVIEKRLRTAGAIAQLVEQRTENPCVPGSIPGGTTLEIRELLKRVALFFYIYTVGFPRFEAAQAGWGATYDNNGVM